MHALQRCPAKLSQAAEAKLKADLDGLGALRESGKARLAPQHCKMHIAANGTVSMSCS